MVNIKAQEKTDGLAFSGKKMNAQNQNETFSGLGIAPRILDVLEKLELKKPTPIQSRAIPPSLEGKDVIGIAQTGTGKTLAFGVPMIQRLAQTKGKGLILLPTRELAIQVEETLLSVGKTLGLKTALLIGGAAMGPQLNALSKNPNIIIGTPGRIMDHLEQKKLDLSEVNICVLDEADRMLDMGFAPQIKKVIQNVPKSRQTLLFCATMPDDIVKIATQYMKMPFRVEITRPGMAAEKIEQELFVLKNDQKLPLLKKLLEQYRGSVLVFSRTKHGARKICYALRNSGYKAAEIHSNRSLIQRREALEGFKSGKYRILTATDIASRGIDVVGIELVINYDIPENPEDYVHRIGRTGRAGQPGRAITMATPEQKNELQEIENLLQTFIMISKLPPDIPPSKLADSPFPARARGARGPKTSGKRPFGQNRQPFGRNRRPFGQNRRPSGFGGRPAPRRRW